MQVGVLALQGGFEPHRAMLGRLGVRTREVRSREQLIHDVWDENWWGSTKTLDVHVASLRKKLRPELIETVRSVGYRFAPVAAE